LSVASGDQADVALAFGPVITETLAAWTDARAGNADIYARRVAPDGTLGGDFMLHPAPGTQTLPQAAYNPDDDEYLVVWADYRKGTSDPDIYGQRVSGAGLLVGQNITVTNAPYRQTRPRVAYAPEQYVYLVGWRHYPGASNYYYDVYGQLISRTGALVSGTIAIADDNNDSNDRESLTDIIYNSVSNKFLALWSDLDTGCWNTWGRHVSVTGVAELNAVQITSLNGRHESSSAGAYNPHDNEYLIVWKYRSSPSAPGDVRGRRMTADEALMDPFDVATGDAQQQYPDVTYLAEAERYVVVWEDNRDSGEGYNVYGQLVSPTGTLDGGNYPITRTTQDEHYPRLDLDGSGDGEALVVWQRDNGGDSGYDLYGRRLGSDGRPLRDAFVILEADEEQRWPVLSGGGGGRYLLSWQDERNGNWDIYAALFQPLRAGFTATPTLGTAPLTVHFSDTSTPAGAADQRRWTFYDGSTLLSTSTAQNPTHVYTQTGLYTVTLYVTDTATGEWDALTETVRIAMLLPRIEAGTVSDVGGDYVTVTLAHSYDEMVVIATPNYDNNSLPVLTRVRNAQGDHFELRLQNPSDQAPQPETVHYLVLEAGVYALPDGRALEARRVTSTLTDRSGSWVGQDVGYAQSYTNPVVLGQVMSENDADWSVFWDRGASRTAPPDSDSLWAGKMVGQDSDTTRADEVLGVVVVEGGDGDLDGVAYRAARGDDIVQGVGNSNPPPPYTYTFDPSFSNPPQVALLSQAAMDGGDGSWAVLYGATPLSTTTLYLAVDEDQIGDGERGHTHERVAYLVFERDLAYPPVVTGLTVTNDSPTMFGEFTTLTATVMSGGDVSYTWNFGDGSPVITTSATMDNGAVISHPYPGGPGAHYTATVIASNSINALTVTTSVSITIWDATPPLNPFLITETHGFQSGVWQGAENMPGFEWEPGRDDVSGVAGYYVYFGPNEAVTPTRFITPTSYLTDTALAEGTYYLRLRTEDRNGNVSEPETSFIFRYDATPPPAPTVSETTGIISGTCQTAQDMPRFRVEGGAQDDVSGWERYQYRWVQGLEAAEPLTVSSGIMTASPVTVSMPFIQHTGQYTFSARSLDRAGNASAWVEYAVCYGQLAANFSADVTQGAAPLRVSFQDDSAPAPLLETFAWDLGDGVTSTLRAPVHVYDAPGVYTVTLQVRADGQSEALTRTSFITVTAPSLYPDFTLTPRVGPVSLTVQFTNTTRISVPQTMTYTWHFGDDSEISHEEHPQHQYERVGTFAVTLTVETATISATTTLTRAVVVVISTLCTGSFKPPAPLWWDEAYFYRQPLTVQAREALTYTPGATTTLALALDAQALISKGLVLESGDDLRLLYWDGAAWGETPRTLAFAHTPSATLFFPLQATIGAGEQDGNYYVYYGNPEAGTPPTLFPDSSGYSAFSHLEGTTLTGTSELGITLTTDFVGAPLRGPAPLMVALTDTSTLTGTGGEIVSRTWSFGDGAAGSGQDVEHTYTEPGLYAVALTVAATQGVTTTLTGTLSRPAYVVVDGRQGVTVTAGLSRTAVVTALLCPVDEPQSITSADGRLQVTFPPGTLSEALIIRYTPLRRSGYLIYFELTAETLDGVAVTHLKPPLELTFDYSAWGLSPVLAQRLRVFRFSQEGTGTSLAAT
ncbi:MAG: PKD domain-containing protein, partial [Anaerolineae bacterium]